MISFSKNWPGAGRLVAWETVFEDVLEAYIVST